MHPQTTVPECSKTHLCFCLLCTGLGPRSDLKTLASYKGEVINGGFGLMLDGTQEAKQKAKVMLCCDVSNGVACRWSGNWKAYEIICQTMQENKGLVVTLPHEVADEHMLQQALWP